MRISTVLVIAMVMLVGAGCASAPAPPPPSVDVTGNWLGTWKAYEGGGGAGTITGTFLQDGTQVRGDFRIEGGPAVNRTFVSGSISGNVISLGVPTTGTLEVAGDEINGVVNGLVPTTLKLHRQR